MKKEKIYEYMENNELNIEAVIKDYSNYIQKESKDILKLFFYFNDIKQIILKDYLYICQ